MADFWMVWPDGQAYHLVPAQTLANYYPCVEGSFAYNFEEVVECVAVEFEVQFLCDDKFHPVYITSRELAVVVLHHDRQNSVHRL